MCLQSMKYLHNDPECSMSVFSLKNLDYVKWLQKIILKQKTCKSFVYKDLKNSKKLKSKKL